MTEPSRLSKCYENVKAVMRGLGVKVGVLAAKGIQSWTAAVWCVGVGIVTLIALLVWGGFFPSSRWTIGLTYVSGSIFTVGILFAWARAEKLHSELPHFTVVKVAQIGYLLWFAGTAIAATIGLVIGLGEGNMPILVTAGFSFIFLGIGANMAGSPRQGWPLRSLLLLKRIANWQLGAAVAILAFGLAVPVSEATVSVLPFGVVLPAATTDTSLFAGLPENFAHLLRLHLIWVVGAAFMTVLLEPLKYKLEALPHRVLQKWEYGQIK